MQESDDHITKTHNTFACSVAYMEGLHFVLQRLVYLRLRSRYLIYGRTFSNLVEKTSYIQHWGEFKNLLF